jgi:hypothetical protein
VAGSGNQLFAYEVVKAFLENVAAYPVGAWVRLSTGETGLVVENKRGFSLRPRVRVFFDGSGGPVKPYELPLWECRDVVVTGVVEEGTVSTPLGKLERV